MNQISPNKKRYTVHFWQTGGKHIAGWHNRIFFSASSDPNAILHAHIIGFDLEEEPGYGPIDEIEVLEKSRVVFALQAFDNPYRPEPREEE